MVQGALPVDTYVDEIVAHAARERFAVVVAPPGSGKTTRIPPALTRLGATILLQPRRVAARALARRIAFERGWTIGEEIGWQIRFERRFGPRTKLLVATEGILTARLQSDPLLSDFRVVVLDEFHERSIHADVALALAKEAAESRDDLSIIVMSATIDASAVSRYLHDARIFEIEARRFSIDVRYRPNGTIREALSETRGDVLCFLPGAREIERARGELAGVDALVLPLHGQLPVDEQERALAPAPRRKVILATNVAETSLTVEGVTDVIDGGLQKILRFDPGSGVDHLVTERISLDSADQRAGRAGRTAPGRAIRLWDARDILRPHREPEIRRVDLASAVLDLIAWGGDPRTFDWFEAPPSDRLEAAIDLLTQLGAIEEMKLTGLGDEIRRYPLHPRLARLIIAANGDERAIAIAAALSEGARLTRSETTDSDAFAIADEAPREIVRELRTLCHPERSEGPGRGGRRADRAARPPRSLADARDDSAILRAIFLAYPDRVAQRREARSDRLLLASGSGATLARESGVREGEFLVALELSGTGGEALVRMASRVEREWLTPTRRETVTVGTKILERAMYGAIVLHEQTVGTIAAAPKQERPKFDGPESIDLPSGRKAKLDYREDGSIFAAVKLQELFGLAETPRVGPRQVPVTFELLAPNGRPVQVTRDLRSFWNNAYQHVRKELRARYPKHPWPDDPWTATPTHRAKRR
ncbi:MAG TPA: ATP-dependent helicase C-terminal domain-containing protein [Thermoanaerobaculia bacterium]|jgi:ATP-dependent helicase HrpB